MSLKWYAFFLMVYVACLACFTIPTLAITFITICLFAIWLAYDILCRILALVVMFFVGMIVWAIDMVFPCKA